MPSIRRSLVTLVIAVGAWAGQKPAQAPAKAAAPVEKPTLVGSETCQACHEDIYTAFQKSRHQSVETDKKRGWAGNGCESCHGPASKHVETASADEIRNPLKLTAALADKGCLTCHLNQPTHSGRLQGGHARSQVACTSCHSVHKAEPEALRAKKIATINTQCASCHQGVWAQFARPHSHQLKQGAMSCTDCHNPHGNQLAKQVQTFASNEPGCLGCHTNTRGPFTFEHAPMRQTGCATCHEVHGSANPRMLTRHEVRFVCLECHANVGSLTSSAPVNSGSGVVPPSFHDLRSTRFQNCTLCHQKIHGSHADRNYLR
jgi:DmsE family decaheme c-type cytochrome